MRATDRLRSFELADRRHAWARTARDTIAWATYAFAALLGLASFSLACYCDDPRALDEDMAFVGIGLVVVAFYVLTCFVIGGSRPALVLGVFMSLLSMPVLATLDLVESMALGVLIGEHIAVIAWCIVRRPTR